MLNTCNLFVYHFIYRFKNGDLIEIQTETKLVQEENPHLYETCVDIIL